MTTQIDIIGSGCAGLSAAYYASQLTDCQIRLLSDQSHHDRQDHIWGFWQTSWLHDAASQASASWQSWQIITDDKTVTHHSNQHGYHALLASNWLNYCAEKAAITTLISLDVPEPQANKIILDSRPPKAPDDCLYQHFIGQHIIASDDIFDPETAILMDFRCDQSQGLHFIYLLPFSANEALVESTLFTPHLCQDAFYISAIKTYLQDHFQLSDYQITRTEKAAIPLAEMKQTDPHHIAIGARSGALRPSSGYGFAFIQKQIQQLVASFRGQGRWHAKPPHRRIDLWMDRVFLKVLSDRQSDAPRYFMLMASALSGDEFAQFMSGIARPATYLKVILAMPKWPFIKAALQIGLPPARHKA